MKKALSITLALVIIVSSLFCLSSCGSNKKLEYNGKEIDSIEHIVTEFDGGAMRYRKHDFKTGNVYEKLYIPEVRDDDYAAIYTVDTALNSALIDALYNAGIFNMEEKYTTDEVILDGGSWDFIIAYSDGTKKISTGINTRPDEVFMNASIAYYDVTGENFFRYPLDSYILPHHLYLDFKEANGRGGTHGFKSAQTYIWKHEKQGTIGEVIFEETDNSTFHLDGAAYTVRVRATDIYEELHRYKYKSVSVVSYDANLNDKQTVDFSEFLWQIKFTAVPYRIYVITMEFDEGIIQYHFNYHPYSDHY